MLKTFARFELWQWFFLLRWKTRKKKSFSSQKRSSGREIEFLIRSGRSKEARTSKRKWKRSCKKYLECWANPDSEECLQKSTDIWSAISVEPKGETNRNKLSKGLFIFVYLFLWCVPGARWMWCGNRKKALTDLLRRVHSGTGRGRGSETGCFFLSRLNGN